MRLLILTMTVALGPGLGAEQVFAQHSASEQGHAATSDAHAPESDGGHTSAQGPEYGLLTVDGMTALWTIVIFVILLIVLRAAAWKPIQKMLQQRERFIRDSLADAKRERVEAQRTLAEYAEKLDRAREEATAIVDEGRRDAEEVRKKILADTKVDAEAVAARAKKEIELARDDAVKQLHDQTILLATRVAGKIVHKELSPGDHQELVDQALTELGELN